MLRNKKNEDLLTLKNYWVRRKNELKYGLHHKNIG